MKKTLIILAVVLAAGAVAYFYGRKSKAGGLGQLRKAYRNGNAQIS